MAQLKPATMALIILVPLLTSAFLVYAVSLFPAYTPYKLNEQFDRLDSDIWDIGGAKKFTVTDGVLNLLNATSADHDFVTNPKFSPPAGEADLQGKIEIVFQISTLPGRSVVVASSDSWRVYVRDGSLVVETTQAPFLGGAVDSSWHTLVVDREANSLQLRMDDTPLFQLSDWSGILKRIELGTAQETVGGLTVQGKLSVDSVTAELQPYVDGNQSIAEGYQVAQTYPVMPHPIIAYGNAHIDTSQSIFGGASGAFLNTGDYLSIPASNDWNFGSGNFTIDFWARFNSLPTNGKAFLFATQGSYPEDWTMSLLNHNYPAGTYQLFFIVQSSGSNTITITANIDPPSTGVWYHIALVRDGSDWYWFLDGRQLRVSGSPNGNPVLDFAAPLIIGRSMDGNLDEYRITKGVARWTSSFKPPTSPYTSDNFTVLLLHMNGSNGSTDFVDSAEAPASAASGSATAAIDITPTRLALREIMPLLGG